jgi:hypothetical protein
LGPILLENSALVGNLSLDEEEQQSAEAAGRGLLLGLATMGQISGSMSTGGETAAERLGARQAA